jgi:hypothetical protein
MYTVPEEDGYNISFKKSGYESVLLVVNASPVVWMYLLYFTAMVFLFGPICLIHKLSDKLATIKKKLSVYFFWNGLIRLYLESSFEMALAAILNIHEVNWGT